MSIVEQGRCQMIRSQTRRAGVRQWLVAWCLGFAVVGCHDLTGSDTLPAGTQDPSYYNNATGALAMRNSAVFTFLDAIPTYLVASGYLTDELTDPSTITNSTGRQLENGSAINNGLDERILPELSYGAIGGYYSDGAYTKLQGVRVALLQAIGQLTTYDVSSKDIVVLPPAKDSVLRAELYALYGVTEIQLADLFCSGVPLSTIDFQKTFTYRAGDSTAHVYRDAIAHFDTAIALASDSAQIQELARIGLGRAYLDLAYTNPAYVQAAADDVSNVPSEYLYQLSGVDGNLANKYGLALPSSVGGTPPLAADREGTNGLPYVSSGDPRSPDTTVDYDAQYDNSVWISTPEVFVTSSGGVWNTVVASGVEARLIQAEAALRAGNPSWLTTLNALRTTGTVVSTYTRLCQNGIQDASGNVMQPGSPCPDSAHAAPGETWRDTTWSPGSGYGLILPGELADVGPVCPTAVGAGVACTDTVWYKGLHPLSDPGIGSTNPDSARLALVFRERAYWLYMTGHRQGDLRRQLRQYPQYWRSQAALYPTGTYLGLGAGFYGTDVTAPIPQSEYINPLFQGCINREP